MANKPMCDACADDAVHCVSFTKGLIEPPSELDDVHCEQFLLCQKCCDLMTFPYILRLMRGRLEALKKGEAVNLKVLRSGRMRSDIPNESNTPKQGEPDGSK